MKQRFQGGKICRFHADDKSKARVARNKAKKLKKMIS